MATTKVMRDGRDGRFVTIISDKKSSGKVGSYEVRTVDSVRFKAAKKAANTALESAGQAPRRK